MEKSIKCIKLIIDNGHLLMILGLEGGELHFINTVENEDKKKNEDNEKESKTEKSIEEVIHQKTSKKEKNNYQNQEEW